MKYHHFGPQNIYLHWSGTFKSEAVIAGFHCTCFHLIPCSFLLNFIKENVIRYKTVIFIQFRTRFDNFFCLIVFLSLANTLNYYLFTYTWELVTWGKTRQDTRLPQLRVGGRGRNWDHFISWAGAVRPETTKQKESKTFFFYLISLLAAEWIKKYYNSKLII